MEVYTLRVQKRKIEKKKIFLSAVLHFCAAICIFIFCNMFFIQIQKNQYEPVNEEYMLAMETYAPIKTVAQASALPSLLEDTDIFKRTRKEPDRNIDFKGLIAANSDIYAWINIPGTDIDYPVVYCDDNEYYLSHDALKGESKSGAIFSDMGNTIGFSDPVTVLYGHRMNDGSMFAELHKFEEVSFFNQNKIVKLFTPEGEWDYQIFAAYQTDNTNILYGKNFTDKEQYQIYLDGLNAIHDTKANMDNELPTADDYILTLSTCVKEAEDSRYVVQAVLR